LWPLNRWLTIALLLAGAAGCASKTALPPSPAPAGASRILDMREGLASYYADRFDGRTTASGSVFDNDSLVAAHPSYPFGSVVRVTNLQNQRTIDVRIVDRGPAPAIFASAVSSSTCHGPPPSGSVSSPTDERAFALKCSRGAAAIDCASLQTPLKGALGSTTIYNRARRILWIDAR